MSQRARRDYDTLNITGSFIKYELEVRDFGCGIPEDKMKHLFIDFSTLDENREKNPSGRGLGLSICKLIVEKMGGSVRVESKIGEGTSFILTLQAKCLELES